MNKFSTASHTHNSGNKHVLKLKRKKYLTWQCHRHRVKRKSQSKKRRWESSTASRVAVIGGDGSFTSLAAERYFVEKIETTHCHSFDSIFDAIEKDQVEYGVLPIENSDLGTIRSGVDKLIQREGIHIVGETYEREKHCLCALHRRRDRAIGKNHQSYRCTGTVQRLLETYS